MSPKEAANGTKRLFQSDNPDRVRHIRDNGESLFHEHNPTRRRHIVEPKGTTTAKKIRRELDDAQVWYQFDHARQFIPRSEYEKIMTPERVLEIIYNLPCFKGRTPQQMQVLAQNIYFGSDGQRPALKIFGALIMSKMEAEMSQHLVSGLNDGCLPLKAKPGDRAFQLHCECSNNSHTAIMNSTDNLSSDRKNFLQWARCLTAPYIAYHPDRHSHYVLDPGNCIPIKFPDPTLEQETSRAENNSDGQAGKPANGGDGGFSEVHKVQLHDCHCRLPDTGLRNSEGYYALKKLISHKRLDFDLELSSLLFSADQNVEKQNAEKQNVEKRYMIQVLATFEELNSDEPTFYFLFDWAEGPLDYFWQLKKSLVGKMQHCLSMSEQFLGLGQALEAIHNDRVNFPLPDDIQDLKNLPDFKNIYGRHGDIKPSNILYFELSTGESRLVLADFGLGRLHTRLSRSNQDPKLLGRTETYRSPEFDLPDGRVGPRADVYSLGCVFLEHITWFLLGADFPDKFSDDRTMKDIYGFDADTFFMLTGPPDLKVAEIKPAVKQCIAMLKDNEACSWYLFQMLELIESEMLICDKKRRIRATPLVKRLRYLQEGCRHSETFYTKRWKDCKCPDLPESGR
ncbi:unnamed protein product [Clonostachys solani]|uniref:Protein kinase domain-containing protein n=1 Tax=Clonostachys solani TaxID=160281 RepID=A0A9N9ZK89_9HYPO|nr:unnamed protein product [Clonostachys solani]